MNEESELSFDSGVYLLNPNDYEPVPEQESSTLSQKIKNKKNNIKYNLTTLQKIANNDESSNSEINIDHLIHILALFQHEAIIKFQGFFQHDFTGAENISIVTECTPNGSLFDYFTNSPKYDFNNITNTKKQIILIGIARVMMILYKYNISQGILTSENVFLDENYYPHLNIFNSKSHLTSKIENENEKIYENSDIISFGCIMDSLLTLSSDTNISESIKNLINRCNSSNPTFEELFRLLSYDKNYYLANVEIDIIFDYIKLIENDIFLCPACESIVKKKDCLHFLGYPYHKNCIKCSICNKEFDPNSTNEDLICLSPALFLCEQHYNEYSTYKFLSPTFFTLYSDKMKINSDKRLFNFPVNKQEEMLNDSKEIEISKHLELFSSSATFHFSDSEPQEMDFSKLEVNLGDDITIIQVEKEFTFLKIAFIASNKIPKVERDYRKLISPIKKLLNTSMGKSIVGNFNNEPEITIPDDAKINEFFNKKSINLLQNTRSLSDVDLRNIKSEVFKHLKDESMPCIFMQKEMFEKAEIQVRNDVYYNPFEMIIIGQTLIANKYFDEYNQIRSKIPDENIYERFVYHGSHLANYPTIVSKHFYMDGSNKHDDGFYGKGIYATDNMFYALGYAKPNFELLKFNEKASVILCSSICNKDYIVDIKKDSVIEQDDIEISKETKVNYGIHHILVGSSTRYQPITEYDIDNNLVVANEFVFPNTYQIIPICSFTVMRADHFILWKDENIENNENEKYMKALSHRIKVNVYFENSVDDALNLIEIKKHNRIKLITNGGESLTGKKLIEDARKIIRSNFVCLVFARNKDHLNWITEMENVLFTDDSELFKEFAGMDMDKKTILGFVSQLEEIYSVKFNIVERSLLSFPLLNKL